MIEALVQSPFGEIAALLALAAAIGIVGSLLRQPLIVSFIAVGVAAGPSALALTRSADQLTLLAELGIALLLFLVGIKLDVKLIRSLGAVAIFTGLGQVIFTSLFGYLIGLALGLDHVTSLYVAIALTFSSTIIVVKLLSDKREIDSLHGQIALGILIVQDLVVVVALMVLSAIGIGAGHGGHGATGAGGGAAVLSALGAGAGLVALVVLFVRYVADPLTARLARSQELLLVFALALVVTFAAVGDLAGLGKEVGGLLAGVALASTRYRETVASRLGPLRDFLLLFFFIGLGSKLDLSLLGANVIGAVALSLFVLVGKPLIVLAIIGAMGYRKRTGFLAGLTLAQISEFSLIFIAMGAAIGHVGDEALGLVTMVGLVTIAASSYMITFSIRLFALCEPLLGVFERRNTPRERDDAAGRGDERVAVIIFGLGRFGAAIGMRLARRGVRVLGVDFNPDAVRRWQARGLDALYGDATDPEFVAELPLRHADWIAVTVPVHPTGLSYEDARTTLLQLSRGAGFRGRLAVTSHSAAETERLRAAGADIVLEPFQDAADRAADLLSGTPPEARIPIPELDEEEPLPRRGAA